MNDPRHLSPPPERFNIGRYCLAEHAAARPDKTHSKMKGFPPCGHPFSWAQAGQRKPAGQRAVNSQAAQAASSG